MLRLRDEAGLDGAEAEAARLLRGMSAPAPSDEARRRVLAAMTTAPPPKLVLRAPLVGAAVALTAAAVVWAVYHHVHRAPAPLPPAIVAPSVIGPIAPPASTTTAPAVPPPIAPVHHRADASRVKPAAAPPTTIDAPAVPPQETPPEAVLVLDAVRALHREHDPRKAMQLLDVYRQHYPHGALEEESLALVIEAKAALADPGAMPAAREYLRRFPRGRFSALATQTLAGARP